MSRLEYCRTCGKKTAPAVGEHPESHWDCSVCGRDYWIDPARVIEAARVRALNPELVEAAELGAWVTGGLEPDQAAEMAERVAASPRLTQLAAEIREQLAEFDAFDPEEVM